MRVLYAELDAGMRLIKIWKDKWPDQTRTIQGMLSYLDLNVWRLCEFIESAKKNGGFSAPAAGTPAGKIYETILQCKYEAWCYVLAAVSSGDYDPPNDPQGKPKTHVGPESEKQEWKDAQENAGYDVDRKG